MKRRTSFFLDFELVQDVKKIYASYGAKNLSALVNGFFYYLVYGENPVNGVDIALLFQDCLSGGLSRTRDAQLLSAGVKQKMVFAYLDAEWGRPFLVLIRRFGLRKYLQNDCFIHERCEEMYSKHEIVILEDDMRRYLTEWYEAARADRSSFEEVELEVLRSGGLSAGRRKEFEED